jgi:hypothetical protein
MLAKYMRRLNSQDCPVVLSITDTSVNQARESETVIQRNYVRETTFTDSNDIYVHAREIYFRARRQRPVRAASIF